MEKEPNFGKKEPSQINKIGDEIKNMSKKELEIFIDYEDNLEKAYQKKGDLEQNIKQAQEMLCSKFGDEWKQYLLLWRIQEKNKKTQRSSEIVQSINSLSKEELCLFERYHKEVGDIFAKEYEIPKDIIKDLLERFGPNGWREIYYLYKKRISSRIKMNYQKRIIRNIIF